MVDWWYEKGDTKYGNNTCRLDFLNLPFYINANRKRKLKNMNAAEGIPTKIKSPADPAESEVTQWLNPRKRNDPRRKSGVISLGSAPGPGPEGRRSLAARANKKEAGKIRPNTVIISQAAFQVNGKMSPSGENLCPAQKQKLAFGKHSVLKSWKFRVIL